MIAFLLALGLAASSFAIHVLVWRVRIPRHQTRALMIIFTAVPLLAAFLGLAARERHPWTMPPVADWIAILLCHAAVTASYLVVYTGIEESSPSLVIMNALAAAPGRGCNREELAALITEERFVTPRLRGLEEGQFVAAEAAGHRLTPRGRRVARLAALVSGMFNIHDSA
jgi:hypothetical protein